MRGEREEVGGGRWEVGGGDRNVRKLAQQVTARSSRQSVRDETQCRTVPMDTVCTVRLVVVRPPVSICSQHLKWQLDHPDHLTDQTSNSQTRTVA